MPAATCFPQHIPIPPERASCPLQLSGRPDSAILQLRTNVTLLGRCLLLLLCTACARPPGAARKSFVEGAFSVIYGDPRPAQSQPSYRYFVALDAGRTIELQLAPSLQDSAARVAQFDRSRIRAAGHWVTKDSVFRVDHMADIRANPSKK